MRKMSKLASSVTSGLLVIGFLMGGSISSFPNDKYETIDATAFGTGDQLGQNIGVTLNIYEFSTPADRQILIQAYSNGTAPGPERGLSRNQSFI